MLKTESMPVSESFVNRVDQYLDTFGPSYGNVLSPGAPWKIAGTVLVYLAFALKVGPRYMKNRKPLKVDALMRVYNVLNIAVNTFIFAVAMFYTNMTLKCWQCLRMSDESPFLLHLVTTKLYLWLKIFDLLDTVFFVLRKKDKQITFLHIVHHSIMPFSIYFGLKLAPFTPSIMMLILNTFVHMVMYSYYLLASYGAKMEPYLWWKKYLTSIQLAQFAIVMVHMTTILLTPNHEFPKSIIFVQLAEAVYFTYAFGKFYVKSYLKGSRSEHREGLKSN